MIYIDEPVKPQHLEESHDIQQILAKACVKYSHQNEDLLRPSLVEEESLRSSLKVRFYFCTAHNL